MYLKRIELQGFKSFPDKLSLDFDNVLAVIVGPNGSGKSNIADAVRWVLGEQSVKSLRGQKWEDVIFAGTQNRKALNFAEVSMTLDNTGHEIDLEFSDVTITRKVFRSGESEYLINGKNCRLKDVRELFMDTGIGKEGYSIIGQGQIDEILNARSEDRRQIFEEASGIVKYKTRRLEAFSKLENEKKNLVRLNDIVAEIESSLEPLRQQSEMAKQFLEMSERLKRYEVNLFIIEEHRLREEIQKTNDIYESNTELINEKKQRHDAQSVRLSESKLEAERLAAEIGELRERVYETRSEQEQFVNKIKINDANIEHFRKDIERLNAEIGEHKDKASKNEDEITLLKTAWNREALLFDANEKSLSEIQLEFEKLNDDLSLSEAEIEQQKNDIIENIKASSEIKNCLNQFKSSLEQASARSTQISENKFKTDALLAQKRTEIEGLQSELEQYAQKRDSLSERKDSLIAQKNELVEQKSAQQSEYNSVSKDVIKCKERLKVLTAMAQEHEGFFRSVKELLKAASLGIVTGIRGVVGEVISVPKEYEIAVEIALGAAVQNIITSDENAAKRAIEFLKHNSYGRATFLPIKTAKPQKEIPKSVLEHNGIIGTVKGLISYEKEFEPVMSGLLERVIVAKNMQNAIEFSRRTGYAYRVVTLGGELISAQGAITGGSLNEKRINVFSRNREIVETDERLERLTKKRGELDTLMKSTDDAVAEVKSELDEVYKDTGQTLLTINTLEQKLETEKSELNHIEEQSVEDEKENSLISGRISELSRVINEKERLLEKTESEGRQIEESISVKQTLTQTDKELRDEKLSEIANLRIKSAEINSHIASLKADIERISHENEVITEGVGVCVEEIQRMRKQAEEAERQSEKYLAEIDNLKSACNALEKEIVEKETLKLDNEEMSEALGRELSELSGLITEISGENIRLESKRDRQSEELQRLFNEMWEDYEITLKEARKYEVIEETPSKMQRAAKELKNEIKTLGNVNVSAIEQYKETKQRYDFLISQKSDILAAEEKLQGIISELTGMMEKTFREQFSRISESFNAVFKVMFGGGKAYLELNDSENPLESGIEIIAELPGKKLQNISLLSGGEKALTAIALLFGILKLKPSPFCILDEIEAALDDANIIRFANYLKMLKDSTQFIVITHRKGTMESANVLYGVTMEEQGVSKLIAVNLEEAVS